MSLLFEKKMKPNISVVDREVLSSMRACDLYGEGVMSPGLSNRVSGKAAGLMRKFASIKGNSS